MDAAWALIAPTAVIATRLATRATVLLTLEAMPACRQSADFRTVAVSGATVSARPKPNRSVADSTAAR